jgi:Protein of unknown function (DUF4242)
MREAGANRSLATMRRRAEPDQHTFLVEHYRPGISIEAFSEAAHRMRQVTRQMPSIRFLHSTLVPEDETSFCVFLAPTRAVVEEAYRRAGVPFERIVDALELELRTTDGEAS